MYGSEINEYMATPGTWKIHYVIRPQKTVERCPIPSRPGSVTDQKRKSGRNMRVQRVPGI
jgi:hypothetical protein